MRDKLTLVVEDTINPLTLQEWRDKGHVIVRMENAKYGEYDGVVGTRCWRYVEGCEKMMFKAIRAEKRYSEFAKPKRGEKHVM